MFTHGLLSCFRRINVNDGSLSTFSCSGCFKIWLKTNVYTDIVVVFQKYQCPELPLIDDSLSSSSPPLAPGPIGPPACEPRRTAAALHVLTLTCITLINHAQEHLSSIKSQCTWTLQTSGVPHWWTLQANTSSAFNLSAPELWKHQGAHMWCSRQQKNLWQKPRKSGTLSLGYSAITKIRLLVCTVSFLPTFLARCNGCTVITPCSAVPVPDRL